MRALREALRPGALKKVLSFGGTGSFDQGPFWSRPEPLWPWTASNGRLETIESNFESYVEDCYKKNGPVFTCILVRAWAFSQARFAFQEINDGRPGKLFGGQALKPLESPWPNGTTADLLIRTEQDGSLAGNFYVTPTANGLRRLRPDWVTIISGVINDGVLDEESSPWDPNATVLGYIYAPKPRSGKRPEPVLLTADKVAHFAPIPDPSAQWRGMSWITPILPEVEADTKATRHKLKFFHNGAMSNMVIAYDKAVGETEFRAAAKFFREQHEGVENAYKTIHLGGGADPKMVGGDWKQLDFKTTQGAGETRIAAASGVGAIMARFSEGMQGSALNEGNYKAAKSQFADLTVRPLWGNVAGSFAKLVKVPDGARLWYDDLAVPFVQEDAKDQADIFKVQAEAIRELTDGGYIPDTVIAATVAKDPTLLRHSGRLSVQLHDPSADPTPAGGSS